MKNKIITVLANASLAPAVQYNELFALAAKQMNHLELTRFNRGYTPERLESLKYELQKRNEITLLDIHEYIPAPDESEITQNEEKTEGENGASDAGTGGTESNPAGEISEAELSEQEKELFTALDANEALKESVKIREEYPFLADPNTPVEIKALVQDKFNAWNDFALAHGHLVDADNIAEADEQLFEMAKKAVSAFQLNADIKRELDYYRDTEGRILGEIPQLNEAAIQQEVADLKTMEALILFRGKAQKQISRLKSEINKVGPSEVLEKRLKDWVMRFDLATGRLEKEFGKTFK